MHALQQLGYKKGQTGITRFELGQNPFEIKVDKYREKMTQRKNLSTVNMNGAINHNMTNKITSIIKNDRSKETNELKKIMKKISTIDTSYLSIQPGSGTQNHLSQSQQSRLQNDPVFSTFSQ